MDDRIYTADLVDRFGDAVDSCDIQFLNYGARKHFHGLVSTVRCWQDNALLRSIVQTPGDGCVLVVDGGGSVHTALMGDVLAGMARDSGWAGLVINGAVRDVAALKDLGLGIKAIGSNPRTSAKTGSGERDVLLHLGGVDIRPGMMLVSDNDGVIIGPAELFGDETGVIR